MSKKKKKETSSITTRRHRSCASNGAKAIFSELSSSRDHLLDERHAKTGIRHQCWKECFVHFRAENIICVFPLDMRLLWRFSGRGMHYGKSVWFEIADFNIMCVVAACVWLPSCICWSVFEGVGGGGFKGLSVAFFFVLQWRVSLKVYLKCKHLFLPPSLASPTLSSFSGLCDVLIELFSLADTQRWDTVTDTKRALREETDVGETYTTALRSSIQKKEGVGVGAPIALRKRQTLKTGFVKCGASLLHSYFFLYSGRRQHENSSVTEANFKGFQC